jgi:hypothetical protein
MTQVLKFAALNPKVNQEQNAHMFHMIKANVGYCLTKMSVLDTSYKFDCISKFDHLMEHFDIDNESFKALTMKELENIKITCNRKLGRESSIDSVINALCKVYNLRSLQ